jgi:hypothetical protein
VAFTCPEPLAGYTRNIPVTADDIRTKHRDANGGGARGEFSMKASSLSFKLAVLFVVTGMAMGIAMAASHDHSAMPAHAHLNLLGWVSLFLYGNYDKLHP